MKWLKYIIPGKQFVFIPVILTIVTLHISTIAQAQLCNGSLGDPVVNITFSEPNSTSYVPDNAYTYTGSSCPNDGYYTITQTTSNCFNNAWHTVTRDHTGNGAFMLVNASYEPGDFFLTKVTNLCPNTTYQFASWVMNVLNKYGIRPNLTFSIEAEDGTLLGQYSTGDIPESPEPTWSQYGLFFITPENNPVITLRITNNAPGGNGNDLALDDITFRPCGPPINASIKGNKDTVNICDGNTNTYVLNAIVSADFKEPVYQWQISTDSGASWNDITGANQLLYTRLHTTTGSYFYRLTVIENSLLSITSCHTSSNVIVINVHKNPEVNAGPDRIVISGTPITIQGFVTGESPVYNWVPSSYINNDSSLTPEISPPADISYTLFAITPFGCKNNDGMNIKVVKGIFVPTAFTPNHDGINDSWRIPFLDPAFNASVNIYNRFGQVVYHTNATTVNWDGTFKSFPQPAGVYIYNIRFKSVYPEMKGTLLLIR